MKLHLIMPMGGGGTRFGIRGFQVPKPLIEIYGKPFFYWATESVRKYVDLASLTFVVLQEHCEKFQLDHKIKELYPEADIVVIPGILPGAVLTCMEGVKKISEGEPILFNDCDHLFLCQAFYDFCKNKQFETVEGGLLTFHSDSPAFSYAAYGDDGYVTKTVEKVVISNSAICGAYYFKNKAVFEEAVKIYLDECAYKEFFVSGVYNIMARQKEKIITFSTDKHVSFGTPDEYEAAIENDTYQKLM